MRELIDGMMTCVLLLLLLLLLLVCGWAGRGGTQPRPPPVPGRPEAGEQRSGPREAVVFTEDVTRMRLRAPVV